MIFLKLGHGQGHSDPKLVCDTSPSEDASTHQIWNSYRKEYRSYATDSMPILKLGQRSKAQ